MELRHLRYFVAVAEELNFTRAADKLKLAQPSLSRQVQDLEEELGVQLLDRGKKQISLTEVGRRFLLDAKHIIEQSANSIIAARRFSTGETEELNLGYSFKFNFELLPATLNTFYKLFPEVTVNLFDLSPAKQLEALIARKIDIGFIGLRPPMQKGGLMSLEWELVTSHKIVVVLPAEHPLTKKRSIYISDLKHEFFVTMSENTQPGSRDWLCGLCREAGYAPRILQDVDLEGGIMDFVKEGLGVTLAREQIKRLPKEGVVCRPLSGVPKVEYWLAWHRENSANALLKYRKIIKEESLAIN
jgi:DNA-binding transcriptional LysR family regulator